MTRLVTVRHGEVRQARLGVERPVPSGQGRHGQAWSDVAWRGLGRAGAAWFWLGESRPGEARRGTTGLGGRGMARRGVATRGLARPVKAVKARHGVSRYGMAS
jgi:hypothetical protein